MTWRLIFNQLITILAIYILLPGSNASSQIFSDESVKFSQLLNWIDKYYVDSINQEKLVETAIIKMLQSMDPHSTYLTKEEVKEMSEPLQGSFEGIGVSFDILNDTIIIINPIPGGPSEKLGILAGDKIIMIGKENVAGVGIRTNDVYKRLRGDKGTIVTISVKRRLVPELLDFTITRDKIPIYSVDASYLISEQTGYIKINRFAYTTMDEFHLALAKLKTRGMKELVLDLSGNGGGFLDVAIQLADQFLDQQRMIVYTEGLNHPRKNYYATDKGDFQDGRLVLIIDEGSASASEIVSGAIQDWDRGILVGRRSFGKGLVQSPLKLIDSSMVRLTIARYYTPSGRLIQKPYTKGFDEYSNDLENRYDNGELSEEDRNIFPDSLRYKTLLSGRTVYGGGGIMPDYFVPIDTSYISDYYRNIMSQGVLNNFVLNYLDNYRSELTASYPAFDIFRDNYSVTDDLMKQLIDFAGTRNIAYDEKGYESCKEQLRMLLKANIARDLWNTSSFYEIVNQQNPSLKKALEVLESTAKYQAVLQPK
jgi:carboxyl-terminal processing protease